MGIFGKSLETAGGNQESREAYKPVDETINQREGKERSEGSKEGSVVLSQLGETRKRTFAESVKAGILGKLCQPKYVAATMILIAGIKVAGGMDVDADSFMMGVEDIDFDGLLHGHHDADSVVHAIDNLDVDVDPTPGQDGADKVDPKPVVEDNHKTVQEMYEDAKNNPDSGFKEMKVTYESEQQTGYQEKIDSDYFIKHSEKIGEMPELTKFEKSDFEYVDMDNLEADAAPVTPEKVETPAETPVTPEKDTHEAVKVVKETPSGANLGGKKPPVVKIGGKDGLHDISI